MNIEVSMISECLALHRNLDILLHCTTINFEQLSLKALGLYVQSVHFSLTIQLIVQNGVINKIYECNNTHELAY